MFTFWLIVGAVFVLGLYFWNPKPILEEGEKMEDYTGDISIMYDTRMLFLGLLLLDLAIFSIIGPTDINIFISSYFLIGAPMLLFGVATVLSKKHNFFTRRALLWEKEKENGKKWLGWSLITFGAVLIVIGIGLIWPV